ncbi:alpha-L-fucosidase [Schaalia sp. Marseille-Q2122]|uniref:alpha-L-fucosidase n=1 Tax=Schaalia sp. Marseille-Q2122 TaxID=2736604 RepID=UPI00158EA7CC|nr:alpha-L-fucosidase [Schaalia sp. Marseille-Q2122]
MKSITVLARVLCAVTATTALTATSLIATSAAHAADNDALNVAFGGSLVGTQQYTTTEGEIMRGTLQGASGNESQISSGVSLGGGQQGLRFTASDLTLGQERISKSFVMETIFVPKGEQGALATLMSAGGNFSVRYDGDQLKYGWDTNGTGRWVKHLGGVTPPSNGQPHVFSAHYRVKDDGAVILNAMLDGVELPTVEGPSAANIAAEGAKLFGFGNDVHPQARNRGFNGELHRIRVHETADQPTTRAMFEFQPQPNTEDLLRTSWVGTLDDTYAGADSELVEGTATRKGNAAASDGSLTFSGNTDAVIFTPTTDALSAQDLTKGFIVETTFTPQGTQADMATLVSVGGNFFARYQGGKLRYGYAARSQNAWPNFTAETDIPSANQEHTLSLAYFPGDNGTVTVTAWLDGVALTPISGNLPTRQNESVAGSAAFGNEVNPGANTRGFVGSIGESRFSLLNGPLRPNDFVLQELAEVCADISDVEPGNYIDISAEDCSANILKKAALVRPTEKQAVWQEEGLTAFMHYGINTYTKASNGNIGIEWGYGRVPASEFNPTGEVDADTWVRTLRDSGYRTAILVLKHHDGFMSWPTRYSDYDVASSPWKDGKGDLLRDFTDAAHKYGMKVGVYISPADSHEETRIGGTHGNGSARSPRTIPTLVDGDDRAGKIPEDKVFVYEATDYGAFFLNTLYEVLTEYGEIHEVWFDGATGNTERPELYDYDAYYDMIYRLQPGANVAVGGRDIRWIGNERGEARNNEWSPLPITDPGTGKINLFQPGGPFNQNLGSDEQLIAAARSGRGVNKLHWWPAEADMKLTQGWFAHHNAQGVNIDRPKSAAQLMRHYEETVGRNSVMLLNVPPTITGSFADSAVSAIQNFAAERRKAYTRDHALGLPVTIGDTTTDQLTNGNVRDGVTRPSDDRTPFEIDLGVPKTVHRLGISEDILNSGQVIRSFTVHAELDGEWTEIASSGVIGSQRIIKLGSGDTGITSQKFRITVTSARADYTISSFQLYETLASDPGLPNAVWINCAAERAGTGTETSPFNSLEQLRKQELAPGATLHFRAGVDCADANLTVWAYGTQDDPVELLTWGEGTAPTVGGKPLAEHFARYSAQGWSLPEQPTDSGDPNEPALPLKPSLSITSGVVADEDGIPRVQPGTNVTFALKGLEQGKEATFTVYSEPHRVGTVKAGADGIASITWPVPADFERGRHRVVATGDFNEITLHFLVKETAKPDRDQETPSAGTPNDGPSSTKTNTKVTAPGKKSSSPSQLAFTGASGIALLGSALLISLLGGTTVLAHRKRVKE